MNKIPFENVPRTILTLNILYIKRFKPIVKEFIGTPVGNHPCAGVDSGLVGKNVQVIIRIFGRTDVSISRRGLSEKWLYGQSNDTQPHRWSSSPMPAEEDAEKWGPRRPSEGGRRAPILLQKTSKIIC
jgi:hypothetical protein